MIFAQVAGRASVLNSIKFYENVAIKLFTFQYLHIYIRNIYIYLQHTAGKWHATCVLQKGSRRLAYWLLWQRSERVGGRWVLTGNYIISVKNATAGATIEEKWQTYFRAVAHYEWKRDKENATIFIQPVRGKASKNWNFFADNWYPEIKETSYIPEKTFAYQIGW